MISPHTSIDDTEWRITLRISQEAESAMAQLLEGRPEAAGIRFFLRGYG